MEVIFFLSRRHAIYKVILSDQFRGGTFILKKGGVFSTRTDRKSDKSMHMYIKQFLKEA